MSKRSISPGGESPRAKKATVDPEWDDNVSDDEFVEGVLPPPTQEPIETVIEEVLPPESSTRVYRVQREEDPPQQSGSGSAEQQPFSSEMTILESREADYPRFRMVKYVKRVKVEFSFENIDPNNLVVEDIIPYKEKIDKIYGQLTYLTLNKYRNSDYYMVMIDNSDLDEPIVIPYKTKSMYTRDEFTNKLFKVVQSNKKFLFNAFTFTMFVSETATGRGRHIRASRTKPPITISQNSKRKRSVVVIKNKSNDCGYRAVYVGFEYFCKGFDEHENLQELAAKDALTGEYRSKYYEWKQITASCGQAYQQYGAYSLCFRVNEFLHWKVCPSHSTEMPTARINEVLQCPHYIQILNDKMAFSFDHYEPMQEYLASFLLQLVVIDASDPANAIYCGKPPGYLEANYDTIYIEWISTAAGGHYNWIRDYYKYATDTIFCRRCLTSHNRLDHNCKLNCTYCGKLGKCEGGPNVDCERCGRTYVNEKCYERHMENTNENRINGCYSFKAYCQKCDISYYENEAKNAHKCGLFKCTKCNEKYTEHPHYCYLKPLNKKLLQDQDEEIKVIVCFDIESTVIVENGKEIHNPNLLCASVVCTCCWNDKEKRKVFNASTQGDEGDKDICIVCGYGVFTFDGLACVKSFCDYLYGGLAKQTAEQLEAQVYVFAHNAKGYDAHFILQDLYSRNFVDKPDIIMKGQKILKIQINNVSFLDSLSFFQQPLSALPKSFGFTDIVLKGFFPHKFNKPENFQYIGVIPPLSEFEPEFMKSKSAAECRKWHSEYHGEWNFEQELIKYCINDVKILELAVMEFRRTFKDVTDLDPITRNITLPSVAYEDYKANFLKKKTFGITPVQGYGEVKQNSIKGNIWLDWIQKTYDNPIKREQKVGRYWVDGYCFEDNHVFEFFGCFYHGCKCKTTNRDVSRPKFGGLCLDDLLKKTEERIEFFEERDCQFTYIWEHEYDNMMKPTNPLVNYQLIETRNERRKYHKFIKQNGHINIRDAFFGGRTENIAFNYNCKRGEEMKYFDFISLYPTVLTESAFPVGHPDIVSEFDSNDISEYFGFIRCDVLPPNDLHIPVLPMRSNNRLVFALCSKCADSMAITSCEHSDNERVLSGTWFSEELKLALTKGYVIKDLIEVLHYDETSNEMFELYIRKWLKIKTEASGWPVGCNSLEAKKDFIKEYYSNEKIALDFNKMVSNPGLRFIAKLMLNSLWGKFAQRPNMTKTTLVTEYQQFHDLIRDAKIEITGQIVVNQNLIILSHKFVDDNYDDAKKTSVAIAAMVTAYGRMRLYKELDKIEASKRGRVLYYDTDSVIFIDRPSKLNWYRPPTGNYLGDLTDEIIKDYKIGSYISKFASGGAKNYAFEVTDAKGKKYLNTKIKGINITEDLVPILNYKKIERMAKRYQNNRPIEENVRQFEIRSDKLHNVYSRTYQKKYRVVSEKRIVFDDGVVQTFPYGYK